MNDVGGPIGGGANIIPAPPAGTPSRPGPRGQDAVRDILANARAAAPGGDGEGHELQDNGEPSAGPGGPDLGISQPTSEGAGAPDEGGKLSLNDLAEKAGVSLDDLYSAELALPDDQGTISLEALKTGHRDAQRIRERADELDERTREFENNQIRARQEITALLKQIPQEALAPEVLEAAAEEHKAAVDQNLHALLEVKPEWSDPHVFRQAREDILSAVSDYGFARDEVESVFDYRLIKLLHDFHQLRKQVSEANALHKQVRSKGSTKATTSGAAAKPAPALSDELRAKAKGGSQMAQLEATRELLRQQNGS